MTTIGSITFHKHNAAIDALREILMICDESLADENCDYHKALQFVRAITMLKLKVLEEV